MIAHVAAALARASSIDPRISLFLRSDGEPIDDRSWEVVCHVTGRPPFRVHGPVHSDDVDMLAGCVATGAARWVDIQRRRLSIRVV